MQIIFSPAEAEQFFHTALCNAAGTGYMNGMGLTINYPEGEYFEAKQRLIEQNKEHCYEDILMGILRSGGTLTMIDEEADDEGEIVGSVVLQDIHNKINKVPVDNLINFIQENDDAGDADVLLQTVFLGEVVYG